MPARHKRQFRITTLSRQRFEGQIQLFDVPDAAAADNVWRDNQGADAVTKGECNRSYLQRQRRRRFNPTSRPDRFNPTGFYVQLVLLGTVHTARQARMRCPCPSVESAFEHPHVILGGAAINDLSSGSDPLLASPSR